MNELEVFKNENFGIVRTVTKDGEPWFVAVDVCKALEIANNRDALVRLDADEKGVAITDTLGGKQQTTIISESGLYSLVLTSRKPEAKEFKRWITHEVIPSIRKHGAYATTTTIESIIADPESGIKLLQALKEEKEKNKELEAQAETNRPKVLFAEAVETSDSSILVGELAKILKQNGVDIGQNRLFAWLREHGYIMHNGNLPTQRSMNLKLMEIKERTINEPNGSVRVTQTTKITGKGQQFFINKFLGGVI